MGLIRCLRHATVRGGHLVPVTGRGLTGDLPAADTYAHIA